MIISHKHKFIFIIEEHNKIGGLGDTLFSLNKENKYRNIIKHFAIDDSFVKIVGDNKYIRKELKLDAYSIFDKIKNTLKEYNNEN